MFRKANTLMALAMVLSAAACNNSIVGPTTSAGGNGSPTPRPVNEHDKVCLDELRAVEITSPGSSVYVNAGDLVTITFEAREYCSGYVATSRVSYDGGATWQQLDQRKQATSAGWRVPELDDVRPIIEVTLDDGAGDLRSDRVELAHGILVRRPAPPVRDPDEHD
jgi:hypothetical protein